MQLKSVDKVDNPTQITNPFTNVRKLVSDGNKFLYVVTVDAVYRVDMTVADIFKAATDDPTEARISQDKIVKIASTDGSTSDGTKKILDGTDSFFDALVVQRDDTSKKNKAFACNKQRVVFE